MTEPTLQSEKLEPCEPSISDAINEVERLYDEWWDTDRRRWLNVVLERLRARKDLGSRAPVVAPQETDLVSRKAIVERCRELEAKFNWQLAAEVVTGIRQFVESLPAASSPPSSPVPPIVRICAWCKEEIITVYLGADGNRYCSVECQLQYEAETRRAGANWERAAEKGATQWPAATPTPVEQEHPYFAHARKCKQCGPSGFCSEGARLYNAAPSRSVREAEEIAVRIVGTVFDNTAANPETLKQTMIERIADYLHGQALFQSTCSPVSAAGGDEEREFLAASVAVWREIDRLSALPEGYKGLPPDTDPRKRELLAWQRYRATIDAADSVGEEGK